MIARSLLYVPGTRPDRFDKAIASGADAIILDLEDAVPHPEKDIARAAVTAWLRAHATLTVVVRVNGGDLLEQDTREVIAAGARAVSLPKATPESIGFLERVIGDRDITIIALVETAAGVLDARAIAESPHVTRLAIGEADLGAELGIDPSPDEREFAGARAHIVLASAAAGIDPPVGPISTDFTDLTALRARTDAIRRMGFGGCSAIHPAQVGVINDVFTPAPEAIAAARKLLDMFDAAGGGVCLDDNGRMVDEAIVRAARRTLAAAQRKK